MESLVADLTQPLESDQAKLAATDEWASSRTSVNGMGMVRVQRLSVSGPVSPNWATNSEDYNQTPTAFLGPHPREDVEVVGVSMQGIGKDAPVNGSRCVFSDGSTTVGVPTIYSVHLWDLMNAIQKAVNLLANAQMSKVLKMDVVSLAALLLAFLHNHRRRQSIEKGIPE